MDPRLDGIPLRPLKADVKEKPLRGESSRQKLNPDAGDVLELARATAQIEPKQMADTMGVSHSLVLRGLKSVDDLGFHRLWLLSDAYWLELLLAIAKKRLTAGVDVETHIRIRKIA